MMRGRLYLRRMGIPVVCMLLAALLAACGGTAASSGKAASAPAAPSAAAEPAAKAPPALAPIKIAYSVATGTDLPLFLAEDDHLFQKYGLAPTVTAMHGPNIMNAALENSEINIGVGGTTQIRLIQSGAAVRYIAGWVQYGVFGVYGPPSLHNLAHWLANPANVIAVGPPTGAPELALEQYLITQHIPLSRHARFLFASSAAAEFASLKAGTVGAAVLPDPVSTYAREAGFHDLLNTASSKVPLLGSGVLAPTAWARAHASLVYRFLEATTEAIHLARGNPSLAKAALQKTLHITDPTALQNTYRHIIPYLHLDPRVNLTALRQYLILTKNPAAKTMKRSQYIDDTYVDQLLASPFIKSLRS